MSALTPITSLTASHRAMRILRLGVVENPGMGNCGPEALSHELIKHHVSTDNPVLVRLRVIKQLRDFWSLYIDFVYDRDLVKHVNGTKIYDMVKWEQYLQYMSLSTSPFDHAEWRAAGDVYTAIDIVFLKVHSDGSTIVQQMFNDSDAAKVLQASGAITVSALQKIALRPRPTAIIFFTHNAAINGVGHFQGTESIILSAADLDWEAADLAAAKAQTVGTLSLPGETSKGKSTSRARVSGGQFGALSDSDESDDDEGGDSENNSCIGTTTVPITTGTGSKEGPLLAALAKMVVLPATAIAPVMQLVTTLKGTADRLVTQVPHERVKDTTMLSGGASFISWNLTDELLAGISLSTGELSHRNGTADALINAVNTRTTPGAAIGDVYSKGTHSNLKLAMKNTSLTEFHSFERGHVCRHGITESGDEESVMVLPLEIIAIAACQAVVQVFIDKITKGEKATGSVSTEDVYAKLSSWKIACGRGCFAVTKSMISNIIDLSSGLQSVSVGASVTRALFFLDAFNDAFDECIPDSLQKVFIEMPLPCGKWPSFFQRGVYECAVVRLTDVPKMLVALVRTPHEVSFQTVTCNIGPQGSGLTHGRYVCCRSQRPDPSKPHEYIGKGIGCPFTIDIHSPLYGPEALVIIRTSGIHHPKCGDSQYIAMAPIVERAISERLDINISNLKHINHAHDMATAAGVEYDNASDSLLKAGTLPPPATSAAARSRYTRIGELPVATGKIEFPMCSCGSTSSHDNIGGDWIACERAQNCRGSFQGWYHCKCLGIREAPAVFVCKSCELNLPSVLTHIKYSASVTAAGTKTATSLTAQLSALALGDFVQPLIPLAPVAVKKVATALTGTHTLTVETAMDVLSEVCSTNCTYH